MQASDAKERQSREKGQNIQDKQKCYRILSIGYLFVISAISYCAYQGLIPSSLLNFPLYDTISHFLLLGIAAFLFHQAAGLYSVRWVGLAIPVMPALLAVVATTDEFLQTFAATRSFTLSDLLANLVGIIVFTYLAEKKGKQSS